MKKSDEKEKNITDKKLCEVVYTPPDLLDTSKIWTKQEFQILKPKNEEETRNGDFWYLYCSVFTADLLVFVAGTGLTWISPVIPKLLRDDSPLGEPITVIQSGLLASLFSAGIIIGPFFFGQLADRIGRRNTLIALALPMTIGLIILAFATDVRLYYLARLLYGTSLGGCFAVLTMYMTEIAEIHTRGKYGCLFSLFFSFGMFYPYCVGPFLSIKLFSLSCLLPLLIFLIMFVKFLPESPIYLVKNQNFDSAKEVLIKLRSSNTNIEKELLDIKEFVNQTKDLKTGYIQLFKSKALQKPFIIGIGLVAAQQLSGIGPVAAFLQPIFIASGKTKIPSEYAALGVGSIKALIIIATSAIVEKFGRKCLLLVSSVGMSVSSLSLGLYFFIHRRNPEISEYMWWFPIVILIIYVMGFNIGLGPIPWTVASEIFPSNIRATATASLTTICFLVAASMEFLFPILNHYCGMAISFWIFGGWSLLSSIFIFLIVPETRGKSLLEIQNMFTRFK